MIVNQVLEVLDDSTDGYIQKKDFKEALLKVAKDNNIQINGQDFDEIADELYINDDGTNVEEISRQQVREAMKLIPEIKTMNQ